MLQPAKGSQDVFPIVAIRLLSGDAPQENEIEGPGVINIGCNVDEILADPPKAGRSTEVLSGAKQQGDSADKWYKQLAESAPEEHDESSKGREDYVACFMEREVYQVHEGHDIIGHLHGGEKVPQEVEEQEAIDGYSPGKVKEINLFIHAEKKIDQ